MWASRLAVVLKRTALAVAATFFLCAWARADGIVFPADAGVVNVTDPLYGAVPDDGIDDRAAIQSALDAHPSGNTIFYFPDGVYDLSNTLWPAISSGVTKRNIFQGQSETGTVLRLMDNLNHTDAIVNWRTGPPQFFRNGVRDLTLDIGTGNPNAVGLRFTANNQGIVRNVTIRSEDRGAIGLDMAYHNAIGPILVQDITVDGFDTGVETRWGASQTLDGVTLRNQGTVGWLNRSGQHIWVRNLQSTNAVTALDNTDQGKVVLLDSELTGVGGASAVPAINNGNFLYARNVQTSGYAKAIKHSEGSRGNHGLETGYVEEYWADGAYQDNLRRGGTLELFPSPDTSLKLPVKPVPRVPWDDLSNWAGPHQFGGAADDGLDDTAAIQAAIDSGATTVYFPRGRWDVQGTVEIRGDVRRLIGTEARVKGTGTIRLVEGTSDTVVVERIEAGTKCEYEHACGRTWVFNDVIGFHYEPTAEEPGDLFLTDVCGPTVTFRNQNVWARQLNCEGDTEVDPDKEAKVLNDGGTVWILGLKTEDAGTLVKTKNGGMTELLGALHVSHHGEEPTLVTHESYASTVSVRGSNNGIVEETRNGVTHFGSLGKADLYSAFPAEAILYREVIVDNADAQGVLTEGTWTSSDAFHGGFIDQDFLFATSGVANRVTFTPDLPYAGLYEVFIRWVDDRSGEDHSGHADNALVEIDFDGGTDTFRIDQNTGGGKWVSLGTYDFLAGSDGSVVISAEGANGKVIADGARFVVIPEPATLALVALGGVSLFARRRRR